MKKLTSILLAVLMLFSMFAVTASAATSAPNITVSANKTEANVGDTVTVTVKVPANSDLIAFTGSVYYSSEYFEYTSNTTGGLFGYEMISNPSGEVRFVGATDGKVTSSGTLCTVSFKVLKTGGKLTFSASEIYVLDGTNEKDVTSQASSISITIKAPTCKHTNTQGTVIKAATCSAEGKREIKCKDCGVLVKTETIAKTAHKFGTATVTKEPTCSATGSKTATCSVCGEKKTETIAKKTTHNFDLTKEKISKEATCTTEGVKQNYCKDCKKYIDNGIIPATGHVYEVVTEKVEPTCTTDGKEVGKCNTCDEVAETVIPATGHTYGEWVETVKPTDKKAGEKERTCSVCGEVEKETIAKLAKEEKTTEAEEEEKGISPLVIIIPVAVVAAAGLALAIVMILRKKKTNE